MLGHVRSWSQRSCSTPTYLPTYLLTEGEAEKQETDKRRRHIKTCSSIMRGRLLIFHLGPLNEEASTILGAYSLCDLCRRGVMKVMMTTFGRIPLGPEMAIYQLCTIYIICHAPTLNSTSYYVQVRSALYTLTGYIYHVLQLHLAIAL